MIHRLRCKHDKRHLHMRVPFVGWDSFDLSGVSFLNA